MSHPFRDTSFLGQDVASFEETQQMLAVLKILVLGNQDVAGAKFKLAAEVVARLCKSWFI